MGDDIGNFLAHYHHQFAATLWQALTGEYAARYRPVFQVAWWAMMSVFGHDMKAFELANVAINGACGVVFFWMAYQLSGKIAVVSLALSVAFGMVEIYSSIKSLRRRGYSKA